jgi:hypothetical protein
MDNLPSVCLKISWAQPGTTALGAVPLATLSKGVWYLCQVKNLQSFLRAQGARLGQWKTPTDTPTCQILFASCAHFAK